MKFLKSNLFLDFIGFICVFFGFCYFLRDHVSDFNYVCDNYPYVIVIVFLVTLVFQSIFWCIYDCFIFLIHKIRSKKVN